MTKQSKSGEVKDSHHEVRNLDDHLGDKFITGDDNKHKWEGQEIEVKSDPMIEEVGGQPVILRSLYFKANPQVMKDRKPTKQEIFNSHLKQIEMMLWADGLQPFTEIEPKIIVSKKRDEYKIFIGCTPRPGVMLSYKDKPQTLQQLTNHNGQPANA